MDRKFLYVIAALIILVLGAGITWQIWGQRLVARAMVPTVAFKAEPPQPQTAYADPRMWYSRPPNSENDPALWAKSASPA